MALTRFLDGAARLQRGATSRLLQELRVSSSADLLVSTVSLGATTRHFARAIWPTSPVQGTRRPLPRPVPLRVTWVALSYSEHLSSPIVGPPLPCQPCRAAPLLSPPPQWRQGHTWLSDKLVGTHQIGHWAMKLVSLHSIMQHARDYGLQRPFARFAFARSDLKLQELEAAIFDIVRSALPEPVPSRESTLYRLDIDESLRLANLTDGAAGSRLDAAARKKVSASSVYKRGDQNEKEKALAAMSGDNSTLTGGVCFEHATHSKLMEVGC